MLATVTIRGLPAFLSHTKAKGPGPVVLPGWILARWGAGGLGEDFPI